MIKMNKIKLWETVRNNIIGKYSFIEGPFGKRLLTYADYTASGRGVYFIEHYIEKILELYGNTHTEDDATGKITTEFMKSAENIIKKAYNAPEQYKIIHDGFGSTGAIHRLQKIIGIYVPPALREKIIKLTKDFFYDNTEIYEKYTEYILNNRPVVFVGPYEHHSNELTWREGFAEVIEIELNSKGLIDLKNLSKKLKDRRFKDRLKIGSFSACSNVTGLITPVYEIARILHDNNAYAFFDLSACAPYLSLEVYKDKNNYLDAIFFSPHKFLGGPGSCGILIFHEKLYNLNLPPTCSGGGTVTYVGFKDQVYVNDIETREKPGTPGIIPLIKAALAVELKELLGKSKIEKRERDITKKALEYLVKIPGFELLGNKDPNKRIGIVSFNVKYNNQYMHPKFIVTLLNDLFGIQARAGCSCAGPYGHRLLNINDKKSREYRKKIEMGLEGVKPGWVRISFHYLMEDAEIYFILKAVEFVVKNAKYFLPEYLFDIKTGSWIYRNYEEKDWEISITDAINMQNRAKNTKVNPEKLYKRYLIEAEKILTKIKGKFHSKNVIETKDDLISFVYYKTE